MAAYQEHKDELESLGAYVVAATVDDKETAAKLAQEQGYTFPVAYGVTEDDIRELDPWWNEDQHGRYTQPMEFLITRGGSVFGAMYATGPIGRMHVDEVLNSIRNRERRRVEAEASETTATSPTTT